MYLCMVLNKLKHIIFYFYLRLKNKKAAERLPISLQKAKSVGILFFADNIQQNDLVLAFSQQLKALQKEVQLLGYLPKREFGFQYPFPYISNKDISWYGKPGGGTTGYFERSPFDLIIDFSVGDCLPLEYISAVSAAKFRVGFNKDIQNSNYDLILISNEKSNISNLIQNLEKYLK